MSSSSSTTSVLIHAGLAAAISAAGLVLLQTDSASRLLLGPARLRAKRRNEYRYRWQRALELAVLRFRYARAGGVQHYSEEIEEQSTVRLASKENIQHLVDQIYAGQDDEFKIARVGRDNGEVFVWLISESIQYQVPLIAFVDKMEDALDRHVMTATLCFISDASGGVASSLIESLVTACFADSVAVMETPLWIVQLSVLIDQSQISTGNVEQVLSCLCRLHAHLHKSKKSASTVFYTIPTALVPILSCWLQEAFPDDRHVFCYTGCVRAVEHALATKSRRASLPSSGCVPSVRQSLLWDDPVATATPLSKRPVEAISSGIAAPDAFVAALASLPLACADAVEAWVGAVDAFCALKENDTTNEYLPYVCRLDYLHPSGQEQQQLVVVEEGSDRYWSVRSLLQYVTGSQNRELSSEAMDAAASVLADFCPGRVELAPGGAAAAATRRAIDAAAFQHRQILIESKTLADTVRPARHWTLKAAARKGGCSCCAPEEEDDEEEDGGGPNGGAANVASSLFSPAGPGGTSGYVDGKAVFAFDPTRFS